MYKSASNVFDPNTTIHILSIPFQLGPSVSTFKNKGAVVFYMQFFYSFFQFAFR